MVGDYCVACFNSTENIVMPCGHPMCETCAIKWLQRKPVCPTCQHIVLTIVPCTHVPEHSKIIQPANNGEHIGISLSSHSKGLKVTRVTRRSQTHSSGIRQGDIVTHLNGIPHNKQAHAIALIDCANRCKTPVKCTVLKENFWTQMKTMFRTRFPCTFNKPG
jgi:predicted metalloprotease with PDZ domain